MITDSRPKCAKSIVNHFQTKTAQRPYPLGLFCDFDVKTLPIKLPPFYEECLKYFSECSASNKGVQNLLATDILKTVLWNNKAICINSKSVYNHKLASIGIRTIGDLISENNELITKHKLRELNISPLDAFRLTCVIEAIPTEWQKGLKTCQYITAEPFNLQDRIQIHLNGQNVPISKAVLKIIYKELRDRIITPPTAQFKYNDLFKNDVLDWKQIYSLPHRVALDTKLHEFQYKLLNRCLASNAFLCKIGILSSPACSLCGEADESLEHLFVTCHYSVNFWGEVIKWISSLDIQIVSLCCKDIIFGITDSKEELFVNHILLIAKKYIYSCKCNKVKPSFLVFLAKVKTIYKLEATSGQPI